MAGKPRVKVTWSDDLSYNSEEEREKERLANAEFETLSPAKPSYLDDDLNKLVGFIKKMTTLYGLWEDDWNDECYTVIKEFMMEPMHSIVTIFFDDDKLTALLGIPTIPVYDLTYFLREPDMIFTVDGFHDEVTFGTFVETVEGSLLKMLELVYAPVFFSVTNWPENVKNEFCTQMHMFLAKLTNFHYKTQGMTVMYVPREGLTMSVEEASSKKEYVARLEEVVVYWTHRMKSCIEDQVMNAQTTLLCPSDQIDFWCYRYENLSGVHYQIQNPNVQRIVRILISTHSSYIKHFLKLCEEVEETIAEAKSNIEYLQLIRGPCDSMENAKSPADIPNHISKILNTVRYIWMESPFYNTPDRLTNFLNSLSNQVIIQCSVSIDLKALFGGKTRKTMESLGKCIECCHKYKEIYEAVADTHNNMNPGSWELDNDIIFNNVDSFVQRCVDVLDICNGMIIFGRIDEEENITMPRFGGTKGEEFEKICSKFEQLFKDALSIIENKQESILNVFDISWYDIILEFRNSLQHIEVLIENLVNSVFKTINNLEEGVRVLCAMFYYNKRVNLKRVFEEKTTEVWNIFGEEIEDIKEKIVEERKRHPANSPQYAGQAIMLSLRKDRLAYVKKVMDSAHWMMTCSNSTDYLYKYELLIQAIDLTIHNIWTSWMLTVDENIGAGLDRTLICVSRSRKLLLECNVDRNIYRQLNEAWHWQNIEWEIPENLKQIFLKGKDIIYVYESVLAIVKGYNRLINYLSDEERELFKPLIDECKKTIEPGFTTIKWSFGIPDAFIKSCLQSIGELQEFLDCYKLCNHHIVKVLEKVCDTPLLQFDSYQLFELDAFQKSLKNIMNGAMVVLLSLYKDIITYLVIVFEGFEKHIAKIPNPWLRYIKNYDTLLEIAILRTVKTSMFNILNIVTGDVSVGPLPLIRMKIILSNLKVEFVPTQDAVQSTFVGVLPSILQLMDELPRLYERFKLPAAGLRRFHNVIERDPEIKGIQDNITEEVKGALKRVQQHADTWLSFRHIWKIPKKEFMLNYIVQKPKASDFDYDITRYIDLVQEVQERETNVQVHILQLNYMGLSTSIVKHCMEWQQMFVYYLQEVARRDLKAVYTYIDKSSKAAMYKPINLKELQISIVTYEKLVGERSTKEAEFPPLRDYIDLLAKFNVQNLEDLYDDFDKIDPTWIEYLALLERAKKNLNNNMEYFKNDLLQQAQVFKDNAAKFLEDFLAAVPKSKDLTSKDALAQLKATRDKLKKMRDAEQNIINGLNVFNLSLPVNQELLAIEKELEKLEEVWDLVNKWETAWDKYKSGSFWTLETEEIEETVQNLFRSFNRLSRQLKDKEWSIIDFTRTKVDAFRRTIPLLGDLKNPCMRERHWDRIRTLMNSDFDQNSPDFKLEVIIKLNFQFYSEEISEISTAATMELNIETGLKLITDVWANTMYEMEYHRDNIYRIKSVDEVCQFLEDHQVLLSSMKSTKYVEPFIVEVEYWEKSLGYVAEAIEVALQVQRRWLYLENIFFGEDIRKQLPAESQKFDNLSSEWRDITSNMYKGKNAIEACFYKPSPFLLNNLNKIIDDLEGIQRTLERYLETKRMLFPRFYFISNDDLLEILGNSKKPHLIQTHLKKLFDNLNKMILDKTNAGVPVAKGMMSEDGETLEWKGNVILDGPAEIWLSNLEISMRAVLKLTLLQTRAALKKAGVQREKWINEWPGQLGITCSKMQWTSDCIRHLCLCRLAGERKPMKKLRKKQNRILQTLLVMSRKDIPKMLRLKVNALAVIEIHSRDVVDKLYKISCIDVTSFDWFSQLKFFWDTGKDDCVIRQTNTQFYYTYEYIGNSGRLVITPLTDRCYITLTTALNLFRGGSPQGPAGTGKTETVKDLGRALARWVVVTNCSDGLDYKSMAKCYAGIAQSGCWGCFDEFNRINIEVLSVVAQQILCVLLAVSQGLKRFVFEGCEIKLINACGIFITMNPGYAGRTELPDNLKSMFRPISMCVPDNLIIAENTLFSDGFQEYKSAAKKVFTLYELCKRQLSKQDHYDFGLRSMVALLRYAGVKRRTHPHLPEMEIVILAMRDMNTARLTAKDVPLFDGIIKDIFPDSSAPVVDYEMIHNGIIAEMKLVGLQPIPIGLLKVIQVMETKNSRHSTMVLGDTNTAKSVTWRILLSTLTRLKRENKPGFELVRYYPINPKALNLAELYGEYNLATGEWTDGVISSVMRTICQEETPDQKWIVFDGPVDAVWIENLNSVMDDNKLLTLINSERINMPPMVSLLFEARDLSVASPATVSRCGMVYNDYKDWGWWPYVNSWLETLKDLKYRDDLREIFTFFLQRTLDFKRLNMKEGAGVEGQELTGVRCLCRLLYIMAPNPPPPLGGDNEEDNVLTLNKMWFLFCLVWSVCATLEEASRKKFDSWLRELEGIFPIKGMVYDYYVDPVRRMFVPWEEKLSDTWRFNAELGFHSILVPTVESFRVQHLSVLLIKAGFGVLLGGPSGTGKSSLMQGVINLFDADVFSNLIMNISAQTTSANVQDMIEARLEKRSKGNYVPAGGKRMVSFMDDMNMPARDEYGSQPPLEFIRQWLDYGFWYDRLKQWKKNVKNMVVVGAVGPPGGARSPLPPRLLSCFHSFYLPAPTHSQLLKIFGTMISQHFADFDEETKSAGKILLLTTMDIFNIVVAKLLPTPTKMHYLFNLRDISKIFQGLLRSNKDYQNTKVAILRLWIHETYRVFYDRLIDEPDRSWFANLLNEMLGKHFDTTFNTVCPEKRCPVFGDFINPFKIYEDILSLDTLRTYIEHQLEEYNCSAGVVRMDLVLFKYAIEHVAKIIRVISQPRGNMLLVGIGGSGRQSLTRVASYICEYNTYQVVVTKNYGSKEFREDLKGLYTSTGVDNKRTTFVFSDTQIAEESFTEIINNLLSSGEITNLFKPDEFEDIKSNLEKPMKNANVLQTQENTYLFLVNRVRSNLHIVVCMSPIGDAFRSRLRQYPALISCTTIDWFLEWPREALLEVAYKFLTGLDLVVSITGEKLKSVDFSGTNVLKNSIASVMSLMQSSVSQYSIKMFQESKRTNYVTPTNYLELVTGYKEMLTKKRTEIAGNANKLRNGLSKLEETRISVGSMSADLEVAKGQVAEFTAKCLEYMGVINVQQQNADEQQKSVAIKSKKTGEEEIVCKKLAEAAMKDLAGAMPALEEAVAALDALNKKDITEIKSYAKPPATIQLVLEAVMILLRSPTSWADTKRVIGDQYFLEKLRFFDKNNIQEKILTKIKVYTKNPEFEPEKVGTVSLAAKSLCLWVRAIEKYGIAYKIVKPKQEKLDEALASLALKQQILADAMAKLRDLSEMLERLQKEYDEKLETKEDLARRAIALQASLDRADALLDGLGGEKDRWVATVTNLDARFLALPGDCLIATAFISYLGPFGSEYREKLMDVWLNEVADEDIPHTEELSIKSFLLDDALLREWNLWGLPGDAFSAENGIIVTNATRWPLAVDPQGQALIWISNMEHKNGIRVIESGQAEYLKVLEQGLIKGLPVLIQNVSEILDPSIDPIMNKALVYIGNRVMIKFNSMVIDFNPNFRLFLTTKLGNPTYTPEVLTKTTMVNFAVKEQGLQAQLLGHVVRKEVPQLELMKDNLVVTIAKNKKTLIDLENELLRLMNESEGSLLANEELFITLQISKKTSVEVKEALQVSQVTEVEIDTARQGYVPVAERASVLFFVLNDLSLIDPMYQFSLEAYTDLFLYSINRSEKTPVLVDRINNLNEYHTYSVYKNTCRALFERHKLVFAFHMLAKIMAQKGQLSSVEYQFLLKGGIVLDRAQQPENPTTWLPEDCWDNMTEMNKLPGFHGVIEAFETYSRDWQGWYLHPEPETQPLIGEWNGICNDFQRLLFVRSLRLDRLTSCITTFISNTMGPRYVEPPVLDIRASWEESQSKTPLLFVLSPGVDPTSALIQLAIDVKMFDKFQSLSLGQGQSVIAERLLKAGMEDGGWVFLANCHLACAWLGTLRGLDAPTVHSRFRLWLSSMADPAFPLGVLQKSIKMTTEPPQGLKGNMARLFANVNEEKFDEGNEKYRKLLFCVSFFHCTLVARKRFRQLGYNVVYSFNNADFDASENLLTIYLNEYEDVPWETLKYLFAVINYGGHITDDWDMRVLIAYINQVFCPDTLETENFRLSPVAAYCMPRDGSLQSYKDHIDMLPTLERAESVGQHSSADVACQAQDAAFMCDSLLQLVATGGGADDSGMDEKVNALATEMISKLPAVIDIETTERMMGAEAVMPLCVSLTQELVYFNSLIVYINIGLRELKKAIAGLVVMSEELEVMYQCLFEGKVPPPWIKARPSVKPLGSWCRELSARGAHLAAWSAAPRVSPTLCWLPAFNQPTGFLTAVMQTTARKEGWPIDTLCWEFTVFALEESAFIRPPQDGGVYIRGLYLEGASWFKKDMHLIEPQAMQLVFPMSPIHFKPIQMGGRRLRNRYTCPAYYYPLRKGAFVVGVELAAGKQDSNFWIKRGTALLCTLGT